MRVLYPHTSTAPIWNEPRKISRGIMTVLAWTAQKGNMLKGTCSGNDRRACCLQRLFPVTVCMWMWSSWKRSIDCVEARFYHSIKCICMYVCIVSRRWPWISICTLNLRMVFHWVVIYKVYLTYYVWVGGVMCMFDVDMGRTFIDDTLISIMIVFF